MRNKVGLSLPLCILSILRGEVKENEVIAIVTSTRCANAAEWNEVLESYSKTYWAKNPEEAKKIANRFWRAECIIQPMLGEKPPAWWGIKLDDQGVVQFGDMGTYWIDI